MYPNLRSSGIAMVIPAATNCAPSMKSTSWRRIISGRWRTLRAGLVAEFAPRLTKVGVIDLAACSLSGSRACAPR
jgi:hypothetical protein